MVDIQSPTAETRRGKKDRKKPQDKNIMVCRVPYGDDNEAINECDTFRCWFDARVAGVYLISV